MISALKKKKKVQAGNDSSNLLQYSSHARKKTTWYERHVITTNTVLCKESEPFSPQPPKRQPAVDTEGASLSKATCRPSLPPSNIPLLESPANLFTHSHRFACKMFSLSKTNPNSWPVCFARFSHQGALCRSCVPRRRHCACFMTDNSGGFVHSFCPCIHSAHLEEAPLLYWRDQTDGFPCWTRRSKKYVSFAMQGSSVAERVSPWSSSSRDLHNRGPRPYSRLTRAQPCRWSSSLAEGRKQKQENGLTV